MVWHDLFWYSVQSVGGQMEEEGGVEEEGISKILTVKGDWQ